MDFAKQIYKDYKAYLNKEVKIADWIKSVRAGKNVGFIVLNDMTGTFFNPIQVVFEDHLDNFEQLKNLVRCAHKWNNGVAPFGQINACGGGLKGH